MRLLTARRLPVVAFVATALFYLPFVSGGFYTDDFPHVVHVRTSAGLGSLLSHTDAFGFYRPLTQLALYVDWRIYGDWAPGFRLTNVLLHACVMGLVAMTALGLTRHARTAALATLVFGLTPKAHPIAVLWASARADILMSLFGLLAVLAWLRWRESGRWTPLAASAAAYALSLLSKETAVALPLLVVFLGPARITRRDIGAAVALAAVGASVIYGRAYTDAVMPWSPDPHYHWRLWPPLWIHNADNYLRRGCIAPLVLLVLVALPAWCRSRAVPSARGLVEGALQAVGCFVILMIPTLGIAARSELYLYLPVLSLCVFAAHVTATALGDQAISMRVTLASATIVLLLVQATFSQEIHRNLLFSGRFVSALRAQTPPGTDHVVVIPADAGTARRMSDSLGYADDVMRVALRREDVSGVFTARETAAPGIRWICREDRGVVTLTPP